MIRFKHVWVVGAIALVYVQCSASSPQEASDKEALAQEDTIIEEVFQEELPPDTIDFNYYDLEKNPAQTSYVQAKHQAKTLRQQLQNQVASGTITLDSVGVVFTEQLVNQLIPHWYGTTWSFEGHTSIPKQGEIACGYFVSTNLSHMGIQVNRYRLAQQAPLQEALSLALQDSIYRFEGEEIATVIEALQQELAEGLYFVGLSSHVGFLLKRKGTLFFIHSNYLDPAQVVIEKAVDSQAFFFSDTFYITPLSTNKKLMQRWLEQETVEVVTE